MFLDLKDDIKYNLKNVNISKLSGWYSYVVYGNWSIKLNVEKEFKYENSIVNSYNSHLFYVKNGEIVHITDIYAAMIDEEKSLYVFTGAYTKDGYRKNGLFKSARENLESAFIDFFEKNKSSLDISKLVFDAILVNDDTKKFLEKWFLNRGYKYDEKHSLEKELIKVVR